LVGAEDSQEAFAAEGASFKEMVMADAEARGEAQRAGMEVSFYKGKYFYYSMVLFTLAVLLMMISWLSPASKMAKGLTTVVWLAGGVGLGLLIAGITMRCLIQMRPPIHNLYDTILFITAVAVFVALFMEYFTRQRLALGVAVILGAGGMYLSLRYEAFEAQDTIQSVRAVLNSNFWLTTHVLAINVGYSAGLLAAAIAHVYIICRFFGVNKGDREFYRGITRMVYGVVCFAVFFSLVGTVLGGVWANDSWGRFWGWDPKENGALMIVLWSLMILHARMGGYIKDLGINIWAVMLGVIVSFSWWGVNQLGVGLHAYGFTDGVWGVLTTAWIIEGVVVLMGLVIFLKEKFGGVPEGKAPGGGGEKRPPGGDVEAGAAV
jgi:ABC-type transport system involved in cytochrome c biogenesis permease subunit